MLLKKYNKNEKADASSPRQVSDAETLVLIEKAYQLILGRPADAGGAQHFLAEFRHSGFDAIDLVEALLTSPEFSRHGLSRAWVARPAARACLALLTDRTPGEAAVESFAGKLAKGLAARD